MTVNTSDFIDKISKNVGLSKDKTKKVIDELAITLQKMDNEGDRLHISGIGTFVTTIRKGRVNNLSKEKKMGKDKKYLKYSPAKAFDKWNEK